MFGSGNCDFSLWRLSLCIPAAPRAPGYAVPIPRCSLNQFMVCFLPGRPCVRLLLRRHLPLVPPKDSGGQSQLHAPRVRQPPAVRLLRPLPAQPSRRGRRPGGGQRLLGVPLLPGQLRRGLHHLLQLRPVQEAGALGSGGRARGLSLDAGLSLEAVYYCVPCDCSGISFVCQAGKCAPAAWPKCRCGAKAACKNGVAQYYGAWCD